MSIDNPVVLDAGSCTFKAGISSLALPCEEEPSVVSFLEDPGLRNTKIQY